MWRKNGTKKSVEVKVSDDAKIGVALAGGTMQEMAALGAFEIETRHYTFLESIPAGWKKGVKTLSDYIKGMKKMSSFFAAKKKKPGTQ